MINNEIPEEQKEAVREWYGSCTLAELLEIRKRLEFAISERREIDT